MIHESQLIGAKMLSSGNYRNEAMISAEEDKMIKLALKNSLLETTGNLKSLEKIEEMAIFYPNAKEFKNPLEYIEKLFS